MSSFGSVLWHINHCRLFNAKSSLYIYIKYIWFGFVWFYGVSTIVGYLMPNPFIYIYNGFYFKQISLPWVQFFVYTQVNVKNQKLQHYWSLTIRLFCVISRAFVMGILPLCRDADGVFYSSNRLGERSGETYSIGNCRSSIELCSGQHLDPGSDPWVSYKVPAPTL